MDILGFLEWLMVLFPILNIYTTLIPGISVGELLLLIVGVIYLFSKKKIEFNKKIIIFYGYIFLITVIRLLSHIGLIDSEGFRSLLSYPLYAIILIIFLNTGDAESFCKKYIITSKIICILSILQFILLRFGIKFPMILPFISNSLSLSYSQMCLRLEDMCGPFTEAAHLAQYISVALVISILNNKNEKYRSFSIALFAITIAMTLKGSAVVLLATIFGVYSIRCLMSRNVQTIAKTFIIVLVAVVGTWVAYVSLDFVRVLFSRVYEISGNGDKSLTGYWGLSGYFRVKYGFDFYSSLGNGEKLFGIGVGSFNLYDRISAMPLRIRELTVSVLLENWRSGITIILIDGGLIGVTLYCIALFKTKNKNQIFFAIVLLVLQCFEASMNTPMWLVLLYLSFNYQKNEYVLERARSINNIYALNKVCVE